MNLEKAAGLVPRECEWKHGDSGDSAGGEKTLSNEKTKEST
jgi:hypothetical protein